MKQIFLILVIVILSGCQKQKTETNMFGIFKNKKELTRKEKTEKILKNKGIKINFNLPNVETEEDTELRKPKEIAKRVTVLAVTNSVAFNGMTGQEAIDYLKKYELWDETTPNEKEFLKNPTEEKKNQETWKCEGIWTLMWALKIVDDLGFPNQLCDLNNIPSSKYPINGNIDPNIFINSITEIRTKSEILDNVDFYYRTNWACVDARLNRIELNKVNSGIVYERQYALNWLVNYLEQEWDEITCDT
ncbi:DUF4272 domain-containing protein [Flavobacterium sp.]|uniref:DUF4272 domain-containing protein n=1 Tax=Flavobacterium sp. TaxID=239 RepID=UPI00286D922B|nr:DUF4272 domain-containing protein [Flavobacterium sp.]